MCGGEAHCLEEFAVCSGRPLSPVLHGNKPQSAGLDRFHPLIRRVQQLFWKLFGALGQLSLLRAAER